ncbi:MAG: hypothetical protein ACFFFH_10045, partial [Candidatus Thorarchaeota archaeon]
MYELDVLRTYIKKANITPRRVLQFSLGVMIILIITGNSISTIAYRSEVSKAVDERSKRLIFTYSPEKRIGVLYSGQDRIIAGTAVSLYNSLRIVYTSIDLIPVTSLDEIKQLSLSQYNIVIYIFNSTMEGITIGDTVSWEEFSVFLKAHPELDHVIGTGNSNNLYRYLPISQNNVWIEGSDVLDAQLVYLWCIWSVADILETKNEDYSDYSKAGINIRKLSLKWFADNIGAVVERNLQPVDPMGEEDLKVKQERYE